MNSRDPGILNSAVPMNRRDCITVSCRRVGERTGRFTGQTCSLRGDGDMKRTAEATFKAAIETHPPTPPIVMDGLYFEKGDTA